MQTLPRVPASRDPLVDREALTTRAWFRFFSLLQDSIGQASRETFTLVQNSTGATLPKGTVVGFAGVGAANLLSVSKYLADGSTPSLASSSSSSARLPRRQRTIAASALPPGA